MKINSLSDLNQFNSAPQMDHSLIMKLRKELEPCIRNCDWITVGIMAYSDTDALGALSSLTDRFKFINFKKTKDLKASGSVFLKANQKTQNVLIRSENGLGEGILITCQYENEYLNSETFGPFSLDFFK